ncbi:MAG: flagellar export chaperone FliS [Moritella sp.]|uniref:flagellar export chaperone FliS n=1 Tax=Moritella sp. PE36 TaxID=58051 RepID=UPI0001568AAD|nr:flagellar export chaperone FliS [Moritella sp. PE36]EDM68229.1 LafC [Moritella sp. PE36]PHR88462.1 MAG: flagellar export chaperone FliS [Moritella sp.]
MNEFDLGYDAYQETNTEAQAATADPHKLVVMLIDGLLDEIARAEGHILGRRYEHKGKSISKCLDIVSGLDAALDMEEGGEVAANLHHLYEYCANTLYNISISNDVEELSTVVNVMENLKEGWANIGRDAA